MTAGTKLCSGSGIGANVFAENGLEPAPSIHNLRYTCLADKLTMSSIVNCGANSFLKISASVGPVLNEIIVPTLPNIALFTSSVIWSIY